MEKGVKICSVGDLKNNLRILQSEARLMKYTGDFDIDGLTKGNPHSLLPLYNHVFTAYNPQFSTEVLELLDDTLCLKSDVRFMEAVYKVLRDLFHFKPSMTKEQFFTMNNFAERKIIMCVDVLRLAQQHCRYKGPKNPTNPNIKVTSIVDNRRCNKKSSTELVISEPSSETGLPRKVSEKVRIKPMAALLGINEDGWQLKTGYLRPHSAEGKPKEDKIEKSSRDKPEKCSVVGNVVHEFSPTSGRDKSVEVVHMPQETGLPRKVSEKVRIKPMAALLGINEDGWQLKTGYLRPHSAEGKPKEDKIEKSSRDKPEKCSVVGNVVHEFSPTSGRDKSVEVVHMPQDKQEKGHLRVADMMPKAHGEWDPSGAVESILAKVRDLPLQLTNFMKAVESRLQKIEERLEQVEGKVAKIPASETQQEAPSQLKSLLETIQARLLLMENRTTLLENKTTISETPERTKTMAVIEEKKEFTPGPFVSLERGDDIFSGSLVSTFSPIRQDASDTNPNNNDTLASIADGDRRLSSTPNQSMNTRPPLQHSGCSTVEGEKTAAVSATDSTVVWENLDSTTQQQVERIRDMLKATQVLLPFTDRQQQQQGDT